MLQYLFLRHPWFEGQRLTASIRIIKIRTHTFPLADLPTAIRYAKDRVDDAIKVVVKARGVSAAHKIAAE